MLDGLQEVNIKREKIFTRAFIITLLLINHSLQEEIDQKASNTTIPSRANSKDFEPTLISSDSKHQRNIDECEIFCLQPDIRLCQCTKEELNKYMSTDMVQTSKDHKQNLNMTLPHIYQSTKEKKTCGEYSVTIRKLNIAMQRIIQSDMHDFYFEPTLDFQIDSPIHHTISNLFYWGDWVGLYSKNPYTEYDNYIPGCIWQIPSGQFSFHSTITIPECRNQIVKLLKEELQKLHVCVWSYERYWSDKNIGPCLCCELNFKDCYECYQCFKNNKLDNDEKLSECLLSDRKTSTNENLSCYRCMNIKNPTFNCQSYEHFLAKMIQEYQIHNKYQVLTSNQNSLLDI